MFPLRFQTSELVHSIAKRIGKMLIRFVIILRQIWLKAKWEQNHAAADANHCSPRFFIKQAISYAEYFD